MVSKCEHDTKTLPSTQLYKKRGMPCVRKRSESIGRQGLSLFFLIQLVLCKRNIVESSSKDFRPSYLQQNELDHLLTHSNPRLLSTRPKEISLPEKSCTERRPKPTLSLEKIETWSDFKFLLENIPPSIESIVVPSFQILKSISDRPIVLESSLHISCVAEGVCIFQDDSNGGGAGTFIVIRGSDAQVTLQGMTFLNASMSAVVVAKNAGNHFNAGTNGQSDSDTDILEQHFCECNFFGNKGPTGGALRVNPQTMVYVESCTFARNLATSGTGDGSSFGAGGGAIYNAARLMRILFSTFDDNSAQVGVLYTKPNSLLLLSQNTFLLGNEQEQYESSAVYVYVEDRSSFLDYGGNRGYDKIKAVGEVSQCNGIYVNNEDECFFFKQFPQNSRQIPAGTKSIVDSNTLSTGSECKNTKGVFRNHAGLLKGCLWLESNDVRKKKNCSGKTELGTMCRRSCRECNSFSTSTTTNENKIRGRNKNKIRDKQQSSNSQQSDVTLPTSAPTPYPTRHPTSTPSSNLWWNPTYQPSRSPMQMGSGSKSAMGDTVVFYVLGDAPYKEKELENDGFPAQIRDIPDDADFVVHVGDMLSSKESECEPSWYEDVATILKNCSAPVFITPGDNDWLDCEPYIGAKNAWAQWKNAFGASSFENNWAPYKFNVAHQSGSLEENISFIYKRVLFFIVHLVSDYYDIESERKQRHREEVAWVKSLVSENKGNFDAMVIIGHAPPSALNKDFFKEKEGGISETVRNLGMPVAYIHGSGHKFVEEYPFNNLDNFLRVQVPGRQAPAVRVSIDPSKLFWFDFRDGGATVASCCKNGWPSQ